MEVGVAGEVMVGAQSHVGMEREQEVVLVTTLHLLMEDHHVLVQVQNLNVAGIENVKHTTEGSVAIMINQIVQYVVAM